MRITFVLSLLALILMCMHALGQQTASEWLNKGKDLYTQGEFEEAIRAYDKAIEIDPKFSQAWVGKGLAYYYLNKYNESIKAYDKAIGLIPSYAEAWYNKGVALYEQGKYDEAIKTFDKTIELDPKWAWPWLTKGYALDVMGKYDEAIKAYDKAIELNPEFAVAWYNKGKALKVLGRNAEAATAFAKAEENVTEENMTFNNATIATYPGKLTQNLLPHIDVRIDSNVKGAEIWLDGVCTFKRTNDEISIEKPGPHTITLHKEGCKEVSKIITFTHEGPLKMLINFDNPNCNQ